MKHEEIYHTCDRCGKKIINPWKEHENGLWYFLKFINPTREILRCCYFGSGYKDERQMDLCRECWKAFERFMRNEKD